MDDFGKRHRFALALAMAKRILPFSRHFLILFLHILGRDLPCDIRIKDVVGRKLYVVVLGDNSKLIYRLTGQDAEYLVVDENTGQINLRRALDYETKNALHFRIHVSDRGRPPMDDSAAAIISVIDVNDNPPDLPGRIEFAVFENHTASVPLGKLNASDRDSGRNAEVTFALLSCTTYPLSGIAHNEVITIPYGSSSYSKASSRPGEVISQVRAIDDDLMENGLVTYRMKVGQPFEITKLFNLDEMSGKLYLRLPVEELVQDTQATSNGSKTKLAKSELLPSEWERGAFYKNENSQLSQQSVFTLIIIVSWCNSHKSGGTLHQKFYSKMEKDTFINQL
ncbi:unnamed protein product [Dicrocoelium dendriticum]|nr:unnamed protein product [Dicrocoelium dendriticum]